MLVGRSIFVIVGSVLFLTVLPARAQDKVVLQLRWDHQFQFAGYYAAKWQGFFDEAGLDVDIRSAFEPDGEFHSVINEVAEGRADFGVAGADILKAQDNGAPLVIASSVFQTSPVAFYSRAKSNVQSPADLLGLRVGTRPGGIAGVELRAMLRAEGIDPTLVPQREIQNNLGINDIASGLLDVASGFTISAGWYAQKRGLNLVALRPQTYGVDFYGDALFTQRRWVEQNPELVQRFVTASLQGWEYALTHPMEIADRISRELSRKIPVEDLTGFNNFQTKPVSRLTLFPFVQLGNTNPSRWQKMHDALMDAGLVTGHFDANQAIFDFARLKREKFEQNVTVAAFFVGAVIAAGILGWIVMWRRNRNVRRRIEEALRESEAHLRTIADNSPSAIFLKGTDGRYIFANQVWHDINNPAGTEIVGKTAHDFLPHETAEASVAIDVKVLETGSSVTEEIKQPHPDGEWHYMLSTKFPVRGDDGDIIAIGVVNTDISELHQAEAALRQAQKMEAVGLLTGGVAHDFNNLLAVIIGSAELLGDKIGDDRQLELIDRAATRGAELTQRLLAFSRQQTLAPQPIDLTELVPSLHGLLHRTLGAPVKIVADVGEHIWPVLADPGQLENALLNLSINARDAMPDGGILEISCENVQLPDSDIRIADEVPAGDYVQITVRDTGTGMTEDILEHALEPFYTTKDVGAGSGLGLPMVYGFARQSGGDVVIKSEPDKGTEVRIFLPRAGADVSQDHSKQDGDLHQGGGEVILVVEDDPDVRELTVTALAGLGYRILEAADANTAMQVLEQEAGNLDLLLCDVVLPGGVSGPELAAKAKDLRPQLKFMFMTGYTSDHLERHKLPSTDISVLKKPFRIKDAASAIQNILAT